jgi:hypothetical protein
MTGESMATFKVVANGINDEKTFKLQEYGECQWGIYKKADYTVLLPNRRKQITL